MIQDACDEQGLPKPAAVIGATDVTTRQLLAIAHRAIRETRRRAWWPKLTKVHTITVANGVAAYAMPVDLDRQIHRTQWNRDRRWEVIGPITPQEWEYRQNGIVASSPRQRFRMMGWTDTQFMIQPTPGSGDAGQIISFEYQSVSAIKPVTWSAGVTFLAGSYCSYNGNIYSTILGGVTGATPPTNTSGSQSDGGVTWDYFSGSYDRFLADTDECLIDESLIGLAVQWRFMQQKGLSYEKIEAEYEKALNAEIASEIGAKTLSLVKAPIPMLISGLNIPETGYGQ